MAAVAAAGGVAGDAGAPLLVRADRGVRGLAGKLQAVIVGGGGLGFACAC